MTRFVLFGPAHLGALGFLALAALGAARASRSPRLRPLVSAAIAVALGAGLVLHFQDLSARRPLRAEDFLPLHLCDMAILLALFALVTRSRLATELLFFWTFTGTLLASVTPALARGFPDLRFITYFTLHGGVIVAAAALVFGQGRWPGRGAVLRAWLLTNLYGAVVLAVDLSLGKNYLYLLEKPRAGTLLDLFGPWPIYIVVVDALALGLFALMGAAARQAEGRLPVRPKRGARSGPRGPGSEPRRVKPRAP